MKERFVFCGDLDAPELGMILDDMWALANSYEIMATPGLYCFTDRALRGGDMFYIPDEQDRLIFILRWS